MLLSFGVTLLAFAVTVGWSVAAQRRTAAYSEELSKGYLPVALKLGQLRATQATLATLIDGLPDERDPVSARLLLGTLSSARHTKFLETKAAIVELGQLKHDEGRPDFGSDLAGIEADVDGDKAGLDRLLAATFEGDKDAINREIVQVGAIEHAGDKRLHALADRVSSSMEMLSNDAKVRESRSIYALIALALLTLGVGVAMSLHVRRLLAPLGQVTERAQAVARGDLAPRDLPRFTRGRDDEIAELAQTFEHMVGAVARARTEALSNERLAAIGKMAAHVTHEIRNPLSSIGLNVELLEEELAGAKDSDAKNLLSAISREVGRLEQLSEEYLRVARLPSPRMEAEDVAALVRDVAAFTKKEMERAGCVVNVTVAEKVPPALFDEAQLRQALLNLLRNAREAMPKGGEIDVEVRAEGMSVVVIVDDRGSGISEEVRARIFDPFFSTKGEGTGLGLAITRQIVEAHGGTISCAPRDGGGTSFRIALPIAPARAT